MTFSTLGRLALTFGMVASATAAYAAETITYKYDAKGRLIEVKRTGTVNNNVESNDESHVFGFRLITLPSWGLCTCGRDGDTQI